MSTKTQWQFALIVLIASPFCLVIESKVFKRCELATILHQSYHLDLEEVAQWVCIAQHSSGFNTAAQVKSSAGGSHGLFQISDVYWCSRPALGAGCNLPCHKLRDDNLSDDLSCAKRIFDEHQRIAADGYTAWKAYQQYCKEKAKSYVQDCFRGKHKGSALSTATRTAHISVNTIQDNLLQKPGRVYERCELARELHGKHKMPMQQIPTWVCIAEHESRLNTAAVGRLNADGSADHGIFQISDLYWCSHDRFRGTGGKACGLPCSKLLDNDITDDVNCIQKIFSEHEALAGDGFTAWTVYKPHCQRQGYEKISNCFRNSYSLEMASNQVPFITKLNLYDKNPFLKNIPNVSDKRHRTPSSRNDIFSDTPYITTTEAVPRKVKVYTRCSLAQELFFKHKLPIDDISTWVCIAEHESQLNTAALGRLNTDGSSDHGLFQINDRYWCDHTQQGGKACNLPCSKLLDDDLRDDVACIKTIFEEHARLSGNGFNAWTVYKPHCQAQNIEHIKTCFDEETFAMVETSQTSASFNVEEISQEKGKIYKKCELAQELYHKHSLPMEQIPKWVCIAQHESSFNTAAVGRLNTDGSADHGLFQISDLYWCSHGQKAGKACNIPCHKLLDSDITDDVKCIRIIHEEHTRISGDGFNAWTVYKPHCAKTKINHIKECFTESEIKQSVLMPNVTSSINSLERAYKTSAKPPAKGKVYTKCELAQELLTKHKIPLEQVPTWVCIAQHGSSLNTAAVGRLNADGSLSHGLFQISDLYWCSHDKYGGKACNIPCDRLLDADITDDMQCIKIIYEEHARISGDGFNAWIVYQPHCHDRKLEDIKSCFTPNQIEQLAKKPSLLKKDKQIQQNLGKTFYSHNPFLNQLKPATLHEATNYKANPFLQNTISGSKSEIPESPAIAPVRIDSRKQQHYQHNPFLSGYLAPSQNYEQNKYLRPLPSTVKPHQFETLTAVNYKNNPFLSGQLSANTLNNLAFKSNAKPSSITQFKNNPFLSHINGDMLISSASKNTSSLLTASNGKVETIKNYINTNDFRTTTAATPKSKTVPTKQLKYAEATKSTTFKYYSQTSTTRKPATTKTISNWFIQNPTMKPKKSNTSWNWHNQRYISATTTTSSPQISNTRQEHRKDYHSLTTVKSSSAVITKPILNLSMIEPATTKHRATNKSYKTTTENWRKWDKTSTSQSKDIQQNWAATKPTAATESWKKWDKSSTSQSNNIQQKAATTKSKTTAKYPRKGDKTTATNDFSTTTENWYKTTTNKYKPTATESYTTTENWRKWDKTSTTKSSSLTPTSSTTRNPTTIDASKNWHKTTTSKYKSITTTQSLTTATAKWAKWDRNPTTKSSATKLQTITENPGNYGTIRTTKTQNSLEDGRSWNRSTSKNPNTIYANSEHIKMESITIPKSKNWEITAIKKSSTTTAEIGKSTSSEKNKKESLTSESRNSTENCRTCSRTTTKTPTTVSLNLQKTDSNLKTKQNTTISKPKTATDNWRIKETKTITKIPKETTDDGTNIKELATQKPLASNENRKRWDSITTTIPIKEENTTRKTFTLLTTTSKPPISTPYKLKSVSSTTATKLATTKPKLLENPKTLTTNFSYSNERAKTVTQTSSPYFNKSSAITSSNTTTADFEKYKNNLFNHPFFANVNEQFSLWHDRVTTKKPSVMSENNQSMPESTLSKDRQNSTLNKAKII